MSAASRRFDDPITGVVNVEAFTGPLKTTKAKRSGTIADRAFEKCRSEASACMASGDWSDAGPRTMVAAFALMHERVYGVPAADLTPTTRLIASFSAGRMLEREFSGDASAMAMFLRWTWTREKDRESWRRANARTGGCISWQFQFNGRLLTDYRLAMARSRAVAQRTG